MQSFYVNENTNGVGNGTFTGLLYRARVLIHYLFLETVVKAQPSTGAEGNPEVAEPSLKFILEPPSEPQNLQGSSASKTTTTFNKSQVIDGDDGDDDEELIKQIERDSYDGRLRACLRSAVPLPSDHFYCNEHRLESGHKNFFGKNKILGILWAVVQAEMLTYRRQKAGDPWTSPNFNMHVLLQSLVAGNRVNLGLLEKQLLKPFAECGDFEEDENICPTMQNVSVDHFSNLDDWHRTTFISIPERYHNR